MQRRSAGCVDLGADFKFVDELLDEPLILFPFNGHVLEGIELIRAGIAGGIDHAAGPFAEEVDHLVAVKAAWDCTFENVQSTNCSLLIFFPTYVGHSKAFG